MKYAFIVIVYSLFQLTVFAQPNPDTLWTRVIGSDENDFGIRIRQTADRGFVVAGSRMNLDMMEDRAVVRRLTAEGNIAWERMYTSPSLTGWATDVRVCNENGYLVSGYEGFQGRVYRVNADGDSLWTWSFHQGYTPGYVFLSPHSGEGCLVIGTNMTNPVVTRLTDSGDTLWRWTTPANPGLWQYGNDIEPTSDQGSVAVISHHFLYPPDPEESATLVKKWSSDDSIEWQTRIEGIILTDIAELHDGGFILCAPEQIVRLNSVGDSLWSLELPGSIRDVCGSAVDPGFMVIATVYDNMQDVEYRYYNEQGALIWSRTVGGMQNDYPIGIDRTSDGGFVIVGATQSFGAHGWDMYVIRTAPDLTGVNPNAVVQLPNNFELSLYPNPFNPSTTISFSLPRTSDVTLAIYDVTGRKVQTVMDQSLNAGEHTVSFDGSALPSGLYFARLTSGEFTRTQKMVLLK